MDEQTALEVAKEALYALVNQGLEFEVSADMDCCPCTLIEACQVLFPDVEIDKPDEDKPEFPGNLHPVFTETNY